MKNNKSWFIIIIAISLFISICLLTGCAADDTFQKLDWYDARGDKLIAYDVENDKYTSQYIPSELCANSADEVGCVLKLDITYSSSTYRNITNMKVSTVSRSGEIINAEIINLHTGETMAKEKFVAEQPDKTTGSGTDYVEKEIVKQWVQSNYVAPKVDKLTEKGETAPSKEIIPEVQEESVRLSALAGNVAQVVPMPDGVIAVLYTDGKVKVVGNEQLSVTVSQWQNVKYLSGDVTHLAGLKENGTVVSSKFNTSDWRNIEKLFCWEDKIAGITTAGEVRAVGFKDGCNPDGLTNIQDICVLGHAVYAITKAGEVIQRNFTYIDPVIDHWNNVEKLYAHGDSFLAMLSNGTFVSTDGEDVSELRDAERIARDRLSEGWLGISDDGKLLVTSKVSDYWAKWGGFPENSNVKDIFSLNYYHWVFVMMDGTVIEIETTRDFCCENWENIEKIAVIRNSRGHVEACYGLKSDGSVIKRTKDETDNYKSWDLVDIFEGKDADVSVKTGGSVRVFGGIVGLTKDGKIVAEGSYRQADVDLLNAQP